MNKGILTFIGMICFVGVLNAAYTVGYSYDDADRLVKTHYPSGDAQLSTFDASSNRTSQVIIDTFPDANESEEVSLEAGSSLAISLPDASGGVYVLVSAPRHGALADLVTGSPTYTPTVGYSGPDSFSYLIREGGEDSAITVVYIDVTQASGSPLLPQVVVTQPLDSTVFDYDTLSVACSGSATDSDGVVGRIEYAFNGGSWQVAEGTDVWSFHVYGLSTGSNTIRVRAIDGDGNSSHVTDLSLVRAANQPPSVSVQSHMSSPTIPSGQSELNIYGLAGDVDGSVIDVKWRLNGAEWQSLGPGGSWSVEVSGLNEGPNVFEVKSEDDALSESSIDQLNIFRAAEDPSNQLIAEWCFELSPESELNDYGWLGTMEYLEGGRSGYCADPASDVRVELPVETLTVGAHSVSLWFWSGTFSGDETLLAIQGAWKLSLQDGQLILSDDVSSFPLGASVPVGQWNNAVLSVEGNGTTSCYVNGVFISSHVITRTVSVDPEEIALGSHLDGQNAFGGFIDEIQIWQTALTNYQQLALYERETTYVTGTATAGGRIEGNGQYFVGRLAGLEAIPNDGYSFTRWTDAVYQASRAIRAKSSSQSFTAEFARELGELSLASNNSAGSWTIVSAPADYTSPRSGSSGLYGLSAPAGEYTISFSGVEFHDEPTIQVVTVLGDGSSSVVGEYVLSLSDRDDDKDGLSEALEYFLGGSTTVPEPELEPTLILSDGQATFRATRHKRAEGMNFQILTSTSLAPGSWTSVTADTEILPTVDDQIESIEYIDTEVEGARFFQIEIEVP